MRQFTNEDQGNNIGFCMLIYSDNGVGKTRSLLGLPDPILHYNTEPRDPRRTLSEDDRYGKKKVVFVENEKKGLEGYDETMEFLNNLISQYDKGEKPYNSIFFDGLSFQQSDYKLSMEDSRFQDAVSDKKRSEILVDRFRIEQADWGGLGSMMQRLTIMLNKLSKYGVYVVATATLIEFPKYNKQLSAAPNFLGTIFPNSFKGYFDFIGLVEPNPKDPNFPYPPIVRFMSDGSFVAKSCSDRLNEKLKIHGYAPLEFEKILKVLNGG